MVNNKADTSADIRIITGDQGAGKTCLASALIVDDCCENIAGIRSDKGLFFKARKLNEEEINSLLKRGIGYNPRKHFRVYSTSGESKVIAKPDNYMIEPGIKVFANYHFYGIRFMYVDLFKIIEHMNTDLMSNGWIVLDESFMTEKRDTMSTVGKMMAWFGAQARRRKLKMIIIAQYTPMVQSRFMQFAKTKVLCEYNKVSQKISADVNKQSTVMKSFDFYAPEYWRFYKHDEIVQVPQYRIDKTLAEMNA